MKKIQMKSITVFVNRILNILLLGIPLSAGVVSAQSLSTPPLVSSRDEAGVDVISGDPLFNLQDLSIGNGVSSLPHSISNGTLPYFWGFNDDYDIAVKAGGTFGDGRIAVVGHSAQLFDKNIIGAGWVPRNGDGSTLKLEKSKLNVNGTDTNTYTYTRRDGLVAIYQYPVIANTELYADGEQFRQITYPNGYEIKVIYDSQGRKQSVLSNTGLQLKYIHDPVKQDPSASKIIAINNAVEYCSPTAISCSLTQVWPTVTYDWPRHSEIFWPPNSNITTTGPTAIKAYFKVTDALGRVTVYTISPHARIYANGTYYSPRIVAVKDWSAVGITANATFTPATTTYKYDNYQHCSINSSGTWSCNILKTGVVAEAKKEGATWVYNYDQPSTQFVTVGSSLGPKGLHSATMNYDGDVNLAAVGVSSFLTEVSTPDGIYVSYGQGKLSRPKSAVVKGKKFLYEHDTIGNLVKVTQQSVNNLPAGVDPKITNAIYQPCTAANFRWCNKATALIDAKSNQTDYTYSDDHGQVTSMTLPADKYGVRAQTRYKYTKLFASYKGESGLVTKATSGVWMLTEESICSEGSALAESCANPSKLVATRYYYGPDSGPNNLWLRGVEKIADGKTLRTCYQYDIYGHVIAETTPKADLASCP